MFCLFKKNEAVNLDISPSYDLSLRVHPQAARGRCRRLLRIRGKLLQFNQRLARHISGVGARFTREHKFIEIMHVQLVDGDAIVAENERTLQMIAEYGSERVRGGKYLSG